MTKINNSIYSEPDFMEVFTSKEVKFPKRWDFVDWPVWLDLYSQNIVLKFLVSDCFYQNDCYAVEMELLFFKGKLTCEIYGAYENSFQEFWNLKRVVSGDDMLIVYVPVAGDSARIPVDEVQILNDFQILQGSWARS